LGKHPAEKYNKPVARIFTAPVTNKKLMQEYIATKGPLSIFKHKWIAREFTKSVAKDISMKTDNWLDEIIYNPPNLNLVYTLREYQPYEAEFSEGQYKFLGPSIYDRKVDGFDFIKGNNPIVYISLGTVIKGATSFFQNCLEAFRHENVDVIISVGEKFDSRKLRNIPSNIYVYNSVPQLEVLKIADVFVTHGGMNSVSESLVSGTPMIVIPFSSDQPINAQCTEKLGVGKRLEYSDANVDSIKEYVLSVLMDANMKDNISKVRELIKQAPGNKGGAEAIMEYYEKYR
jgi:MGT family glycosyltransferase